MQNLMNPYRAFQVAKASFQKLHWGSQPSSLTRRGDTLIVRRSYPPNWPLAGWYLMQEWESLVQAVLPEARIESSSYADRNVRVRFVMLDDNFAEFLRETRDDASFSFDNLTDEAYEEITHALLD